MSPWKVKRGQRGERALPPARVVPQPAPLDEAAQRPDRQLVADADRLVPARRVTRRVQRGHASARPAAMYGSPHDGRNGLHRCRQFAGLRSAPSPTPKVLPWKTLSASISPSSVATSRPCVFGDRRGGLLRALQRGGHDVGDVAGGEVLGDPVGHLTAEFGQVVARQPSVEDAARVLDLAVAHDVHDGDVSAGLVGCALSRSARAHAVASAAARAARAARRPPARAPRRRGPSRRTTTRRRTAADRRPAPASSGRTR